MYYEELSIGQQAEVTRLVTQQDIERFADVSGDHNAVHLDEEYAARTPFKGRIAHGMLSASFISGVLGTKLPGGGTIYVSQSLRFIAPVRPGDRVTTTVTIKEMRETHRSRGEVVCFTRACVGDVAVIEGEAMVLVPKRVLKAA